MNLDRICALCAAEGSNLSKLERDCGLFNLKECVNEKTGWGGTQTLITQKGRETFRLLMPANDTN